MANFNFKVYLPPNFSKEQAEALFKGAIFQNGLKRIFKDNYLVIIKLLKHDSESAASQFHSENVKMLYNTVIVKVLQQMEQNPKIKIMFSNNRMTIDIKLFDYEALTKADVSAGLSSMYERAEGTAKGYGGKEFHVSALSNFIPSYIRYQAPLWKILFQGSKEGKMIRPHPERTFLGSTKGGKRKLRGSKRTFLLVGPPGQYLTKKETPKRATKPFNDPIIFGKNGVFKKSYFLKFIQSVQHDIVSFMDSLSRSVK